MAQVNKMLGTVHGVVGVSSTPNQEDVLNLDDSTLLYLYDNYTICMEYGIPNHVGLYIQINNVKKITVDKKMVHIILLCCLQRFPT